MIRFHFAEFADCAAITGRCPMSARACLEMRKSRDSKVRQRILRHARRNPEMQLQLFSSDQLALLVLRTFCPRLEFAQYLWDRGLSSGGVGRVAPSATSRRAQERSEWQMCLEKNVAGCYSKGVPRMRQPRPRKAPLPARCEKNQPCKKHG